MFAFTSEIGYLLNPVYKKSSQNIHLRTISLHIVIVMGESYFQLQFRTFQYLETLKKVSLHRQTHFIIMLDDMF